MLELSYLRKNSNVDMTKMTRADIQTTPVIYDHPDETGRREYTY